MSLTRLSYDEEAYEQKIKMSTHANTKLLKKPEKLHCLPKLSINNPGNWMRFDSKQAHIESFLTNRDLQLSKYDNVNTCTGNNTCVYENENISKLDEYCCNLENVNSLVLNPRSNFRELSTTDRVFATKNLNEENRIDDRLYIDSRRIVSDINKRYYPKKC